MLVCGRAAHAQQSPTGAFPGGPGGMRPPMRVPVIPTTVSVERDLNYAGSQNPRQTLDVLRPKNQNEKKLPVIVAIHGGAFRFGDKSMELAELVPLVETGAYAGVTINYRLSGEAQWPAQIHDAKAAIRWVRANALRYGFDPNRIGVVGHSAGGFLAAMLGTSGEVAELEGQVGPHRAQISRVSCVVDQFGPADLLAMGGDHDAANSPESALIGGALQENPEKARAASPITYVSSDDPPMFLIHGDRDPMVPYSQSVRLSQRLRDYGVSTVFVTIQGGGHGGFQNPEIGVRVRAFFDRNLRGLSMPISDSPLPNNAPQSSHG